MKGIKPKALGFFGMNFHAFAINFVTLKQKTLKCIFFSVNCEQIPLLPLTAKQCIKQSVAAELHIETFVKQ